MGAVAASGSRGVVSSIAMGHGSNVDVRTRVDVVAVKMFVVERKLRDTLEMP